jgi:tryptophan-rich sensory protein
MREPWPRGGCSPKAGGAVRDQRIDVSIMAGTSGAIAGALCAFIVGPSGEGLMIGGFVGAVSGFYGAHWYKPDWNEPKATVRIIQIAACLGGITANIYVQAGLMGALAASMVGYAIPALCAPAFVFLTSSFRAMIGAMFLIGICIKLTGVGTDAIGWIADQNVEPAGRASESRLATNQLDTQMRLLAQREHDLEWGVLPATGADNNASAQGREAAVTITPYDQQIQTTGAILGSNMPARYARDLIGAIYGRSAQGIDNPAYYSSSGFRSSRKSVPYSGSMIGGGLTGSSDYGPAHQSVDEAYGTGLASTRGTGGAGYSGASGAVALGAGDDPGNVGAIDRSGRYYAPAGPGAYVSTQDGTLYAPAGPNGVINTRTGAFISTTP